MPLLACLFTTSTTIERYPLPSIHPPTLITSPCQWCLEHKDEPNGKQSEKDNDICPSGPDTATHLPSHAMPRTLIITPSQRYLEEKDELIEKVVKKHIVLFLTSTCPLAPCQSIHHQPIKNMQVDVDVDDDDDDDDDHVDVDGVGQCWNRWLHVMASWPLLRWYWEDLIWWGGAGSVIEINGSQDYPFGCCPSRQYA